MTALYLAAKTRESPRQLRDVVNVGFRLMHPRRPPLAVGKLYEALRESVVQCELILLRHLHFDTTFNAPHKVRARSQGEGGPQPGRERPAASHSERGLQPATASAACSQSGPQPDLSRQLPPHHNSAKPPTPPHPQHLLHFVNAIEQSALLWVDDGGPPGTPEATPAAMPRAAAPAQCRQLAAAGIATLNDIYTLEPEVALELAADELAALALLVGCKTQGFHLLPFHSDAFGVWRLFWPGATRPRLESLATRVLESLANAAEAAAAAAAAAGEETAAAAEAGLATGDR